MEKGGKREGKGNGSREIYTVELSVKAYGCDSVETLRRFKIPLKFHGSPGSYARSSIADINRTVRSSPWSSISLGFLGFLAFPALAAVAVSTIDQTTVPYRT